MISFKPYSPEIRDELIGDIALGCKACDRELLSDVFDMLKETYDAGVECAVSVFSECLLIRLFTDEYSFAYPISLSDEGDEPSAVDEIRRYAVKEEIPLVICDVPEECADELATAFANAELTFDEELDSYTLRALSEIMLREELPEITEGDISLTPLRRETDSDLYKRLVSDEKTNEFWGYNYLDDGLSSDELIDVAEGELSRGVALSLAIREDDVFIGEAILYAFDLLGGCECAIRLLPEKRGKGLGSAALSLLLSLSEEIGLKSVYAVVNRENAPSLGLFEKFSKSKEINNDTVRFLLKSR